MATADFKSFKADGTLQFDANAAVFALSNVSGVYTVANTAGSISNGPFYSYISGGSVALVPFTPNLNQIFAFGASNYIHARAGSLQYTDGTYRHIYITNAPVGTGFGLYTFRPANEIGTSTGFGLHLYNAGGVLTYASDQRPLVVTAIVSGVGTSVTLPAGRTYASISQQFAGTASTVYDGTWEGEVNDKNEPNGRLYNYYATASQYGVMWTDGANAQLASFQYSYYTAQYPEQIPSFSGVPYYTPANQTPIYDIPLNNVMFIDVTGYS